MFKKILTFVLICMALISLVGCSSSENSTSTTKSETKKEEITLTDKDISKIKENLDTFTKGTAFDGATFEIDIDKNTLKISVIKPINDIMGSYGTLSADDTVETIRKSLVFDDAYETIQEETGLKFNSMQVFIFNSEEQFKNNDYYTLKSIM